MNRATLANGVTGMLEKREKGVDNRTMNRGLALTVFSLLLFATGLNPETPARSNPRDYSGEIDRAIENYVRGVQSASKDADDEKVRRIFGTDRKHEGEEILEEEESIQFNNAGTPAVHVVQKSETLFAIARRYGIAPADLVKQNAFLNDRPLLIGDRLTLHDGSANRNLPGKHPQNGQPTSVRPGGVDDAAKTNAWKKKEVVTYRIKKYTVKKGETLSGIARKHKISVADLRKLNDMKKKDGLHPDQIILVEKIRVTQHLKYRQYFQMPVEGMITSGFGRRRNPFVPSVFHFHKGIDLGAVIGTRFHAARDGLVIFSGRMQGYGNVIFLRHKDGYITIYGHNKMNLVKNGDIVRQGQTIGEVGRTGIATGPHLHFEVRKMDDVINPFIALKLQEIIEVSTETAHR